MRLFVDMDGTMVQWKNVEAMEILYEEKYFRTLPPYEKVVQQIKGLIHSGVEVYSLSSYLTDSNYALDEKKAWLDEYLPELDENHRIFVEYGDDKSRYIEGGIRKDDYLLDDYTTNLTQWREAGGTGIKMLNDLNHTNKTWEGLFVHYESEMIYSAIMTEMQRVETKGKEIKPVQDRTRFNKKYLDLMAELRQKQNELFKSMHSVSFAKNEAEILSKQYDVDKALSKLIEENMKYDIQINSYLYDRSSDTTYANYGVFSKESRGCILTSYIMCNGDVKTNDEVIKNIWNNSDPIYRYSELSPLTQKLVDKAIAKESFTGITLSYKELLELSDGKKEEIQKFIEEVEDKKLPFDLRTDVYDDSVMEIHFDDNELLCYVDFSTGRSILPKNFLYKKSDDPKDLEVFQLCKIDDESGYYLGDKGTFVKAYDLKVSAEDYDKNGNIVFTSFSNRDISLENNKEYVLSKDMIDAVENDNSIKIWKDFYSPDDTSNNEKTSEKNESIDFEEELEEYER